MSWLSRLFTIPRKQREALNANPLVHFAAQELRSLAISAAQAQVDQTVTDPALAELLKSGIEGAVTSAIPIPDPAAPQPLAGLAPLRIVSPPAPVPWPAQVPVVAAEEVPAPATPPEPATLEDKAEPEPPPWSGS